MNFFRASTVVVVLSFMTACGGDDFYDYSTTDNSVETTTTDTRSSTSTTTTPAPAPAPAVPERVPPVVVVKPVIVVPKIEHPFKNKGDGK